MTPPCMRAPSCVHDAAACMRAPSQADLVSGGSRAKTLEMDLGVARANLQAALDEGGAWAMEVDKVRAAGCCRRG
jgi:hypothetical protein